MNGAEFIVSNLAAEGVDHFFMVPGKLNDPFAPAMTEYGRPIVCAHEGGAAYMADGFARASRGLGVAFGIGGPGIFNMETALAAAKLDRSSMLAISGEVPHGQEGRGGFQDASAQALNDLAAVAPVTAVSSSVSTPDLLSTNLRLAALSALRERAPVHLAVPLDIQEAEVDSTWEPLAEPAFRPAHLDRGALEQALTVFAGPDPPANVILLAGPGVGHSGGADALLKVAERFDIPVATTLGARGLIDEEHDLALGVFGYGGNRWATEAILDPAVEVLIVVGSALSERDTMHWDPKMLPSRALIHVDADADLIGRTWTQSVPVVGSPRAFLADLVALDGPEADGLAHGRTGRIDFLDSLRGSGPRRYGEEDMASGAEPMHPARLVTEARAACPPETVVSVDSGAHRAWMAEYWTSRGNGDYLSLANLGPMGGAIPLGIGGKLARPERPMVVATGDGCMLMHGMEIHTAARYRIPVVILVFDNGSYGNIWYRAREQGSATEALTDIPGIDWVEFARSMGGEGVTITGPDEIGPAFERGLSAGGPFLISARIDKTYPTPIVPWREALAEWHDDH